MKKELGITIANLRPCGACRRPAHDRRGNPVRLRMETGNVIVERFKNLNPTNVCAVLVYGHGRLFGDHPGRKRSKTRCAKIVADMALKAIQLTLR